jgi:GNAT superfamily N-acetyltransferase
MVEIRPVEDRDELRRVFDLLGGQMHPPIDTSDFRFRDLDSHFPDDRPIMVVAVAEGRPVGGALAFRNDNGVVTLRIIAVVEAFRHRGIGRRLVERVESEAQLLGVETIGLGTDEPEVGFYFHLDYTPNLLFQWAYGAELYEQESDAVLSGPLAGLRHWRSSFNDIPQLFVELDEPRLDLRNAGRDIVSACHVGFVMFKKLGVASGGILTAGAAARMRLPVDQIDRIRALRRQVRLSAPSLDGRCGAVSDAIARRFGLTRRWGHLLLLDGSVC